MRAVRFEKDSQSQKVDIVFHDDLPQPEPDASHLLVRVAASSINPSDTLNATGKFPHTTYPRIPGRDFSGTVVAAPPSSPFPTGSEVYGTSGKYLSFTEDGAQAEHILVPLHGVASKPKNLSYAQAGTVGTPYTTAMLALKRADAKPGETVLILGASGSVGTAASQIAKQMGCNVIGTARRAGYQVNSREDPELKTVKELTGGKGADVCIDTVGDVELMHAAMKVLAIDGRLSIIALSGSKTTLQVDVRSFYRAQHRIIGCNSVECTVEMMAEYLQEMVPWFESGAITAFSEESLTTISIEELKGQYEAMISGESKGKKIVVVFEEQGKAK